MGWKKRKDRRDYNHGKNGWVSGNPRYGKAKRSLKSQRAKSNAAAAQEITEIRKEAIQ